MKSGKHLLVDLVDETKYLEERSKKPQKGNLHTFIDRIVRENRDIDYSLILQAQ